MGSALMPIEGLFLLRASIQAQVIERGIRRNETATIKTKKETTETLMCLQPRLSLQKHRCHLNKDW